MSPNSAFPSTPRIHSRMPMMFPLTMMLVLAFAQLCYGLVLPPALTPFPTSLSTQRVTPYPRSRVLPLASPPSPLSSSFSSSSLFLGSAATTPPAAAPPHFQIIAADAMVPMAKRLAEKYPERFTFHPTSWSKFPDGTDHITLSGFSPLNKISGSPVLFLASFHSNEVTLSQFQVLITLLQSFISSLTIVLPYYPTGTMERITLPGQVATAATYAHMFSTLPSCGPATRLMLYDLHTLQNRFYLHDKCVASLQSAVPLMLRRLRAEKGERCHENVTVAFPDDGAAKRFGDSFPGFPSAVCGKVRGPGSARSVRLASGSVAGRDVLVVDDLVQSGGTLEECGREVLRNGARSVSAFVTHAVFPNEAWKSFLRGGGRDVFHKFFTTNSIPTVTDDIIKAEAGRSEKVFEVLDLVDTIVDDLDNKWC